MDVILGPLEENISPDDDAIFAGPGLKQGIEGGFEIAIYTRGQFGENAFVLLLWEQSTDVLPDELRRRVAAHRAEVRVDVGDLATGTDSYHQQIDAFEEGAPAVLVRSHHCRQG